MTNQQLKNVTGACTSFIEELRSRKESVEKRNKRVIKNLQETEFPYTLDDIIETKK